MPLQQALEQACAQDATGEEALLVRAAPPPAPSAATRKKQWLSALQLQLVDTAKKAH